MLGFLPHFNWSFADTFFSLSAKLIIFIEIRVLIYARIFTQVYKRSVVACIYNTRPLTKYVFDRLF